MYAKDKFSSLSTSYKTRIDVDGEISFFSVKKR